MFDDILDKETKQFLLILLGMVIFMVFIYPRINTKLFNLNLSTFGPGSSSNNSTPQSLDQTKDYSMLVDTNIGNFTVDLFEKSAPANILNIINNRSAYNDSTVTDIKPDFLFKINVAKDPSKKTSDEINADFLSLNEIYVRDAKFLREEYDPNDNSTKAFSPENLDKYDGYTLKSFYEQELRYTYSKTLETPKASKYMIYMASKGPNTNGYDFFVLMSNAAPQIDGRYTPIGRVIKGFEVLDKINTSQTDLKVNFVMINKDTRKD